MGRKRQADSIRSTAAAFGVARSSLHRWTKRHGLNLADKRALAALLAEHARPKSPKP